MFPESVSKTNHEKSMSQRNMNKVNVTHFEKHFQST